MLTKIIRGLITDPSLKPSTFCIKKNNLPKTQISTKKNIVNGYKKTIITSFKLIALELESRKKI